MARKIKTKAKYWWFLVWPDSAADNWLAKLNATHLKICVSPLHDKDVWEETIEACEEYPTGHKEGENKKPHYHVFVEYSNTTTLRNVTGIRDLVNGTSLQAIDSAGGAFRYLTHDDNPEKAQYLKQDLIRLNGFDEFDFLELSKADQTRIFKEIDTIIETQNYRFYYQLLHDPDLNNEQYTYIVDNLFKIQKYITDRSAYKNYLKEKQKSLPGSKK